MKIRRKWLLTTALLLALPLNALAQGRMLCWFPPGWKGKGAQTKAIVDALSEHSGIAMSPRIARYYPEILKPFSEGEPAVVYVGSFVQSILHARELGVPLVQAINGKELYGSWMIYPKGHDPEAILRDHPTEIAFTVGASSGESGAKAATGGQAAIRVSNHGAAAAAVKAGKAKAAFVKNFWWEGHRADFPELMAYQVPEISELKNPDYVLTASRGVSPEDREKITRAALAAKDVFGAPEMVPFDPETLDFSLALMRRGGIDPVAYDWK